MEPLVVKLVDGPFDGVTFVEAQAKQFDPSIEVWTFNEVSYRRVSWNGEVLVLAYLYGEEE